MSEPIPPVASSTAEYYRPMPVFVARAPRQRYWLHGVLLLATCFTTLVVGARMEDNFLNNKPIFTYGDETLPMFAIGWVLQHPKNLLLGIPFSLSLLCFLLAHEMGHYLYCRRYGISATLPFFIPAPWTFGTFGAVIRIRSGIRSRTALFDIGIAGPIAGFVVALVVLAISLGLSKPMPVGAAKADLELNYPLIFHGVARVLTWAHVKQGAIGLPLDRVLLHPTALAAWLGMFATALNLLPGGQLDGGHVVFSLAPSAHKFVSRLTIIVLLPMAYYLWTGWLVWAILLQLSSFRHPQVAEWPRVSGVRLWVAGLGLVLLVLTLTPAPFLHSSLPEVMRQLRSQ